VQELIRKLEEISESFDNSHARAQSFRLSTWAHYRFRRIDNTLEIANEGIRYTGKTGHFSMLLVIWCVKSLAHSAKSEPEEAKKALSEAEKIIADRKIMTVYHVPYVMARAQIELADLKSCIALHKPNRKKFRTALGTINDLIRLSKEMRSEYVEAYRLKALVYRMMKKQRKAFKNLALSIQAGQKHNAVLELSRSYYEAGKCLRENGSARSSLLGLSSSEYLLKAKMLFEEMDLQWDLREYDRYMEG
jgi:tetratricopeptide (TPR) repeat protein